MNRVLLLSSLSVLGLGACNVIEDATTIDVNYDVPLIEPTPIDGTAEVLQPATMAIAVDSNNPTQAVAVPGGRKWGPALAANRLVESKGNARIFAINTDKNAQFTAQGPVMFAITVSSTDGDTWGASRGGGTPTTPSECSFTLDPGTDNASMFGVHLADCLVAWEAQNGTPADLAFSVSAALVTPTATLGGPAFSMSGDYTMSTEEVVEVDCATDISMSQDVIDRISDIDFGLTRLDVEGTCDSPVIVGWFALVFDSSGAQAAGGAGLSVLAAGDTKDYHAVVEALGEPALVTGNSVSDVSFSPADPGDFLEAAIKALAGVETGQGGSGVACWLAVGAAPRSGTLSISVNGVARAGL